MSNNSSRPGIDGFTLRRRKPEESMSPDMNKIRVTQSLGGDIKRLKTEIPVVSEGLTKPSQVESAGGLRRADIDASLRAVEEESAQKPKKRKRWFLKKRFIATFVVLLLLVGGGGYFASKIISMSARVFSSGSVLDLFGGGVELQKDTDGRTNILLFGTSEDDVNHDGAALTDSVMVLSIDKANKTAAMVSMPRDMWVTYDTTCEFGYSGKINVVYECAGAADGDLKNIDATKGAVALKNKVGEIFGLDIQYYVKVNYAVVRQLTTALGGVTVNVESDNPKGIYDINTKLKLPNGPATLQGEQALAFVRARGDGGGYGFEGSNFVREQNQQKMIVAIRDKALNLGTLSNPGSVIQMMDALGDNIRTNFSVAEVKSLANMGKDISGNSVTHINLNDGEKRVVITGTSDNGQSIVKPVAGIGNYTKIQSYIKAQMNGGSVESEDATVQVLNGSGKVGAAAAKQTELTQAGLLNITVGDTSYKPGGTQVWYDTSAGKNPKTLAKLASVLGKQPAGIALPAGVTSNADFVIVLGSE